MEVYFSMDITKKDTEITLFSVLLAVAKNKVFEMRYSVHFIIPDEIMKVNDIQYKTGLIWNLADIPN